MAMFVIHMLTALLAVLVAVGAVSGPRSSGMLQAVLARPISRASWLVQRWAALALVVVVYPIVMTSAVLVIVVAIAGYSPLDPVRAIAVLVLEGLVLVSLAIAASSRWSTVVSGVLVISAVGLAWIAGLVEVIGAALHNTIMTTIGVVISLAVPTDALWRGASYYLQSPAFLTLSAAAAEAGGTIPFAGNAPPTVALLAWSVAYAIVLLALAVRAVRRTDL
jgi:ABC-type transport system involved in multi-copper enzyme maturation permease subunit